MYVAHCSANLTKLINAERMKRVRSGSGAARSRELKSMMRAEVAKRVLVEFELGSTCKRGWIVQMVKHDIVGDGGTVEILNRRTIRYVRRGIDGMHERDWHRRERQGHVGWVCGARPGIWR